MKDQLFCPVRKEWVAALPEECVRQRILHYMIEEAGYPLGLLAVEKAIKQFPHIHPQKKAQIPNRRIDLVCFANDKHTHQLFPLITIECKAVPLTPKVIQQVLGYNHFIQAPFVAIANQSHIRTCWFDPIQKEHLFIETLPPYQSLLE